ncbi:hypothetical protein L1987_02453 [Smallanthus sonchifolius]|uniref:Uncharacterized protein n=1 Tax=Smallanthus sonchifolius TaxID=185202 RepID=A0ACB9K815_9ASTR|nr:hypothetical protein L1987_02453 [Smallanthus sonchifolius]
MLATSSVRWSPVNGGAVCLILQSSSHIFFSSITSLDSNLQIQSHNPYNSSVEINGFFIGSMGTRLDSLQSLLTKLPAKQPLTEKEMNKRRDMLANLRTKVTQMASTLNMSNFGNRDSLLGPDTKPADEMTEYLVWTTLDNLDEHVEVTDSRLKRVQKNLAILNKRAKGGCSCLSLLLSVIGIVVLVVALWLIIKYV